MIQPCPSTLTTSEQAEVLHSLEECLPVAHADGDAELVEYLQDQYVAFRQAIGDVPSPVLLDYMEPRG